MNGLRGKFPAMPACEGEWAAIYMEPVMNSGERITVAVTATAAGMHKVVQAIRPEVLECIYGNRHTELLSQVRWVMQSAEKHIASHGSINGWSPPISGIIVGELRAAASSNLEGIVKQAMRFTASLNDLSMTAERDEDPAPRKDEFAKKVTDGVLDHSPEYKIFFNKKMQVSGQNLKTPFNIIAGQYAANFRSLNVRNLSQSMSIAKSKIYDLECLREKMDAFPLEMYELVLGTPPTHDVTLPDSTHELIKEHTESLRETADKQDISVFPVETIEDAVSRVVKKAA